MKTLHCADAGFDCKGIIKANRNAGIYFGVNYQMAIKISGME